MHNGLIELNLRDEPAIAGTDVTVASILEELSLGENIEEICSERHLTVEQVHAALSYAEMSLPQVDPDRLTFSSTRGAATSADELDYSMLVENAGYFSPKSCPLRLPGRYGNRSKHNHLGGGPGIAN